MKQGKQAAKGTVVKDLELMLTYQNYLSSQVQNHQSLL